MPERVRPQAGRSSCSTSTRGACTSIPHGVDHDDLQARDEPREPFLLYPARPWAHKNHPRLFQAFVDLRRELPRPAARADRQRVDRLTRSRTASSRSGSSRATSSPRSTGGGVPRLPEPHEGFGLPAARGDGVRLPRRRVETGALPEVCGNAAVLFDPEDVPRSRQGVREALARADELRERGLAQAASSRGSRAPPGHEAVYLAAAMPS